MLLYFSVQNFRCFRDQVCLDLTRKSFRTVIPREGSSWTDATERVAGIFGANAAGKSTVLLAMSALAGAVQRPGSGVIWQPYAGGGSHPEARTRFEVGFVAHGVRYDYVVEVAGWGIALEELTTSPKGSAARLFRREQTSRDAEVVFRKGASLTGPTAEVRRITTSRMLLLSTAHTYGHPVLAPIAQALLEGVGIRTFSFKARQDELVLRRVALELVDSPQAQEHLTEALLRAADLGICAIEVRKQELTDEVRERVARVLAAMRDGEDIDDAQVPHVQDKVLFTHCGADGETFELPVSAESAGTITWLTTAWHALDALRAGSVLLVDELDASLHPALVRYLVELFQSDVLNTSGAQLVFTSHDVTLLGNAPVRLLEPRTVWFVEKDAEGVADLYSLGDFDNRPGNNSEKRYLAGQFGAVPDIDEGLVMSYLAAAPGQGAA